MALVGVVLGHWLGYVLAVPDPHLRAELLAKSGHGYWLLAVKAAIVFGFATLGSVLVRHVRSRASGEPPVEEGPVALALQLAAVQVPAFVAMEAAERLIVGESLTHLFQHHIFMLGVAVQLAVACIGALVLVCFGRVAAKVASTIVRVAIGRPTADRPVPLPLLALSPQVLAGGNGLRGPPSLSLR